ncbi:MAG TPA: transaldolase, partial [Anaerolineaceae bacterium]|nr:transaldolase [Anaerolineaceae bacterium]
MNNAIKTKQLGQSIWYDNIDREDLENGKMRELVQQGKVYGVTSNPSIFEKSIGSGNIYDLCLQSMAWAGLDTQQIYFELVKQDIQMTADIFRDVYTYTEKVDGYVSVEIDPTLADDTQKSIQEGKNLWAQINRRNVMIKVPATLAGIPVIRALIAEGINVNATLIFSIDRYRDVMEAYLLGIEERLKKGLDVSHIHSVASFFVSRIDTAVDKLLDEKIASGSVEANELKGKIA